MLAQMREAFAARRFAAVIALAEEHAQRFGAAQVRAREALRVQALRQAGRTADAEQHARTVIANHPEHRHALERAAGQTSP